MKRIVYTNHAPKAIGPYSQAVSAAGFLFGSGQIPVCPETGELVSAGIEQQTGQVLKNIQAVLSAEGLTLEHVVRTECYLKDMGDFTLFNGVYGQFFKNEPPARSCVQAARLPKDVLVEIAFTAAYPSVD